MQFVTYILQSEKSGKFYIGYTSDIHARLAKHNDGGSCWTRAGIPWKIVYAKSFSAK